MSVYLDTSENFHPYECDGPGKCRHCDRRKDAGHDSSKCALCDPAYDGGPAVPSREEEKPNAIEMLLDGAT